MDDGFEIERTHGGASSWWVDPKLWEPKPDALRLGQVGLGYWGKNLARNFDELAELRWLCDENSAARAEFAERYPTARVTSNFAEMLADDTVDAVVIATPVPTHYALAKQALEADKHVFVEKPATASSAEMKELISIAQARGLVLMPGHLLLYHPAIQAIKAILDSGELGEVLYLYGERQNLGKSHPDEGVLLSLGVHDLSVLLSLIPEDVVEAEVYGQDVLRSGVEDVVFCFLRFSSGTIAHLHLSWLDPRKRRRLTIVGRDKMLVFDDVDEHHKITIYTKAPQRLAGAPGVWVSPTDTTTYPYIPDAEPLRLECQHFLRLVREGWDGKEMHEGLAVVRMLERLTPRLQPTPQGGTTRC